MVPDLFLNYWGVGNLEIRRYTGKYWISQLVKNPLDKRYIQGGLSCISNFFLYKDYKQL